MAQWFRGVKEDFPWRGTSDPYSVLVSEMMLQQTQVGTVLAGGYYEKWMMQFPDVGALAVADEEAVLKAWEGLGYYRRARNLKRTAEQVRDFHGGIFPDTVEELQKLPGVGRYTAGAVLSFAFGKPAPIVDANVARVFARLFDLREEIDSSQATAPALGMGVRSGAGLRSSGIQCRTHGTRAENLHSVTAKVRELSGGYLVCL